MKTVRDVWEIINDRSPFSAAEGWDNVGLLVGDEQWEVKRIHVALDATEEVIERAAYVKSDLLVTHHPMIFSPLKKIVSEDFIGRRIISLIEHHMAYIAMHTNYDVFGMADLAAKRLSMIETHPLEKMDIKEWPTGQGDGVEAGIGRVGRIEEPLTLEVLAQRVKEAFGLSHVSYFGESQRSIQRVAICPGSGKSMIETAIAEGAEVLVTGDVDHHSGIDALAKGICIIDAGHYGLEHIFIKDQAAYLKEALKDEVEVTIEPFKEPISTI